MTNGDKLKDKCSQIKQDHEKLSKADIFAFNLDYPYDDYFKCFTFL